MDQLTATPIRIPANVRLGPNSTIDGEHAFRRFRSQARPGAGGRRGQRPVRQPGARRERIRPGRRPLLPVQRHPPRANWRSASATTWSSAGTPRSPTPTSTRSPRRSASPTRSRCSPLGNGRERPAVACRPVVIEDDVWIGPNATILKGVRIGAGAFVEPGTLVTRDVPPGARVMGNPVQVVGRCEPWRRERRANRRGTGIRGRSRRTSSSTRRLTSKRRSASACSGRAWRRPLRLGAGVRGLPGTMFDVGPTARVRVGRYAWCSRRADHLRRRGRDRRLHAHLVERGADGHVPGARWTRRSAGGSLRASPPGARRPPAWEPRAGPAGPRSGGTSGSASSRACCRASRLARGRSSARAPSWPRTCRRSPSWPATRRA